MTTKWPLILSIHLVFSSTLFSQSYIKDSATVILKPTKYSFVVLEYGVQYRPTSLEMADYENLASGADILSKSDLEQNTENGLSFSILSAGFGRTKNNLFKRYFSSHSWTFGFIWYRFEQSRESYETYTYVHDTLSSQQGYPDQLVYFDHSKFLGSRYQSTNYGLKISYLTKIFNASRKLNISLGAELYSAVGINAIVSFDYRDTKGPSLVYGPSSGYYKESETESARYSRETNSNLQTAFLPMAELNWNPLRTQSMEFFINYKYGNFVLNIPESRTITKLSSYSGLGFRYDLIPIQKKVRFPLPEE